MSAARLGTLPGSLLFSFWPETQDAGCEDDGCIDRKFQTSYLWPGHPNLTLSTRNGLSWSPTRWREALPSDGFLGSLSVGYTSESFTSTLREETHSRLERDHLVAILALPAWSGCHDSQPAPLYLSQAMKEQGVRGEGAGPHHLTGLCRMAMQKMNAGLAFLAVLYTSTLL